MYKILIIEDEETLSQPLLQHLTKWGYEVLIVNNFRNIMEEFETFSPHLVLLDISLPFFNGYHWCSEIRKKCKVPIIFISSASDNINVVMAINMGGDDFIAKPFDLSVLTAKIEALLRRSYEFTQKDDADRFILSHNDVKLNLSNNVLTFNTFNVDLTKNEAHLLGTLVENHDTIVSRSTLMDKLWQTDCYIDDNTLTVNINRLRKKLQDIGLKDFIKTKKGQGYIV